MLEKLWKRNLWNARKPPIAPLSQINCCPQQSLWGISLTQLGVLTQSMWIIQMDKFFTSFFPVVGCLSRLIFYPLFVSDNSVQPDRSSVSMRQTCSDHIKIVFWGHRFTPKLWATGKILPLRCVNTTSSPVLKHQVFGQLLISATRILFHAAGLTQLPLSLLDIWSLTRIHTDPLRDATQTCWT